VAVTVGEALRQLNLDDDLDDIVELKLYVDAANEWIATKVSDTSPSSVKLAALFLIDHLWDSQRGLASQGPGSDELIVVSSKSYAIPNRVLELLGPYLNSAATSAPQGSFPDACDWPDPSSWP
jgi:hypothetical protein